MTLIKNCRKFRKKTNAKISKISSHWVIFWYISFKSFSFSFIDGVCYALKTYSYLIPSICEKELSLATKLLKLTFCQGYWLLEMDMLNYMEEGKKPEEIQTQLTDYVRVCVYGVQGLSVKYYSVYSFSFPLSLQLSIFLHYWELLKNIIFTLFRVFWLMNVYS